MGQKTWTISANIPGGKGTHSRQATALVRAFALKEYPPEQQEYSSRLTERRIHFLDMVGTARSLRSITSILTGRGDPLITLESVDLDSGEYETQFVRPSSDGRFSLTPNWEIKPPIFLPESRQFNAVVCSKGALYDDDSSEFLIVIPEEESPIGHFWRYCARRIKTPIHSSWADFLWEVALEEQFARELTCHGVQAYDCGVDEYRLREHIIAAGKAGCLSVGDDPEPSSGDLDSSEAVGVCT